MAPGFSEVSNMTLCRAHGINNEKEKETWYWVTCSEIRYKLLAGRCRTYSEHNCRGEDSQMREVMREGRRRLQCTRSGGVAYTWQALFFCISKCVVRTVNIFDNKNLNESVPALSPFLEIRHNITSIYCLSCSFFTWAAASVLPIQRCNPLCQLSYGMCCAGVLPKKLLPATGTQTKSKASSNYTPAMINAGTWCKLSFCKLQCCVRQGRKESRVVFLLSCWKSHNISEVR